jgi:hypothetical protein
MPRKLIAASLQIRAILRDDFPIPVRGNEFGNQPRAHSGAGKRLRQEKDKEKVG